MIESTRTKTTRKSDSEGKGREGTGIGREGRGPFGVWHTKGRNSHSFLQGVVVHYIFFYLYIKILNTIYADPIFVSIFSLRPKFCLDI